MLDEERPHLAKLPDRATLAPYLREDRKVARDGFVSWEGSRYGVHWKWVGYTVQEGQRLCTVEIWAGDERHVELIGRTFLRHFTMDYNGATGSVTLPPIHRRDECGGGLKG